MTAGSIVIMATVRAKAGYGAELHRLLREQAEVRAAEPGNVAYYVSQSDRDDHDFQIFEIYANAAAREEHRRLIRLPSDKFRSRLLEIVEEVKILRRGSLMFAYSGLPAGDYASA